MYCNNCGTQIPENSKFCLNCGTSIENQQSAPQVALPQTEEVVPVENVQTPAFNQQTLVPEPANVKKSTGKSILKKILKNFLSVLCCLSIFASIVFALAVLTFRSSLAPNRITYILDNINIEEIVEDDDIQEKLIVSLDGEEAVEIYEKSTIKEFVENKLNDFADHVLHDAPPVSIEAEEFVELVEENETLIEEISGEPIYVFDYDKIESFGENFEDDDTIDRVADSLKTYCSVTKLIIVVLFALLLCVLLWFIRKNHDALLWGGVAVSLTALLFGVAGLIFKSLASSALASEGIFVAMLAELYLDGIMTPALIYSGCFIVIGAVLIVAYLAAKMIKKGEA